MTRQEDVSEFDKAISALVHAEMREALAAGNPERTAAVVEKLASLLGTTIAIAAGGNPKGIDAMLTGVENYVAEVAAEQTPIGLMIHTGAGVLGEDRDRPQ